MKLNKKISMIFIICMLASFGAGLMVSASSMLEKINAFLNKEIQMTVKGEAWEANVGGQRMYPITYNDSTYLPVRAVSEALQVPIRWEQSTKTVHIAELIEDEATYMGTLETVFVPKGATTEVREAGTSSVQFIPQDDGSLTLALVGSIFEEGDTSMIIPGSRRDGGWSSDDILDIRIDGNGRISGEGFAAPDFKMKFTGQLSPETVNLNIEMEGSFELEPGQFVSDVQAEFNYELARVEQSKAEEVGEEITDAGGEESNMKCTLIGWRFEHIANLSGGPMHMIQVPYCMN